MFSPKMQGYVFGLLSFICSLKGLSCIIWTMKVQDQVNGTLGQNVVLPCVFTHPKQNAYTGDITVKWMQGKKNEIIFQCIFHNKTNGQDDNCNSQRSSERFLLQGNHRKGDISLRINNLQFTDASQYTCRVELDYNKFSNHTTLNVNAPAQILSLSLDLDVLGWKVQCIAQGKPLPQIKWTSSSGLQKNVPFKTFHTNYIVNSSVPFSDQDVYTCQAVNSLGQDQKTFSTNHPNGPGLLVMTGILGCLLLLVLVAVILDLVKRRKNAQRVMLQDMGVQRVQSSVYQDNVTIYANINTSPAGHEARQVGVYSTGPRREGRKEKMIPRAPNIRPPEPPPDIGEK